MEGSSRVDRHSRWFASIDGRYSFVSQDLDYYIYCSFVVVIALLLYIVVVFPNLLAVSRFFYTFTRYSIHSVHTPGLPSLHSRLCPSRWRKIAAEYAVKRETMIALLWAAMVLLLLIYFLPLLYNALTTPSPHLPDSYFLKSSETYPAGAEYPTSPSSEPTSDSTASFAPADDCPATVVTALYDIGRGDKNFGQEKEQSWKNYLGYFQHVLHGSWKLPLSNLQW